MNEKERDIERKITLGAFEYCRVIRPDMFFGDCLSGLANESLEELLTRLYNSYIDENVGLTESDTKYLMSLPASEYREFEKRIQDKLRNMADVSYMIDFMKSVNPKSWMAMR